MFYIYDSVISNDFYFCIPLYKINYEVFFLENRDRIYIQKDMMYEKFNGASEEEKNKKLSDINKHIFFSFSHYHDNSELIIKFSRNYNFNKLKEFLSQIHTIRDRIGSNLLPIDDSNVYIYGKISIELKDVVISGFEGTIMAQITLNPYVIKSKSVLSETIFSIKQIFVLPLHNRFDLLTIEFFSQTDTGLFQSSISLDKIAEYCIHLPTKTNSFNDNNKFDNITIEIPDQKILKLKNKDKEKKDVNLVFSLRLKDYSSYTLLVTENKNKNIIEDMHIKSEEMTIKLLLKRVRKFFVLMSDLKMAYKNLFRFQYPNLSKFALLLLSTYLLFTNSIYFLQHIIFAIILVVMINSKFYLNNFKERVDDYLFSIKNEYYNDCEILGKDEYENIEVKQPDYLVAIKKKTLMNSIIEPIKALKDLNKNLTNFVFTFSKHIAFLEKFKNLLLWTDPVLTLNFLIMMIIIFLIFYGINFKYMILISIWGKFGSNYNYFKKKYYNNLEVSSVLIQHHYNEYFNKKFLINVIFSNNNGGITDDKFEKFKNYVREKLEDELNIVIPDEFLKKIKKCEELREMMCKCHEILRTKESNVCNDFFKKNDKIFKPKLDVEDIFYYFVCNIKSDYYISKNTDYSEE